MARQSARVTRLFLLVCLLSSAVLLVAEEDPASAETDDVDRTDFSDPALQEDIVTPVGPNSEVEPASLMPDLLEDGKVPQGVESHLLISLANLGSKMFNVTGADGVLQDAETGKRLQKFAKYEFGEPLNPREQRSFRFGFTPKEQLKLGDYRFVFSVYYTNKDKDPFVDVVYNETATLVVKPPSTEDTLLYAAVGVGVLLLAVLLYALVPKSKGAKKAAAKEAAAKKAPAAKATPAVADEWLAGTLAGGVSPKKKKRA